MNMVAVLIIPPFLILEVSQTVMINTVNIKYNPFEVSRLFEQGGMKGEYPRREC